MPMHSAEHGWCQAWALTAVLCLVAVACSNNQSRVTASLAAPRGMALAGPDRQLLFIANSAEDTVQIVELDHLLENITFVRSSAVYFSLRLPGGASPSDVAATPKGDYVVVLSNISAQLHLIDAVRL